MFGVSRGTIAVKLFRSRARLKKLLRALGFANPLFLKLVPQRVDGFLELQDFRVGVVGHLLDALAFLDFLLFQGIAQRVDGGPQMRHFRLGVVDGPLNRRLPAKRQPLDLGLKPGEFVDTLPVVMGGCRHHAPHPFEQINSWQYSSLSQPIQPPKMVVSCHYRWRIILERRKFIRHEVAIPVRISDGERGISAQTVNISGSGLALKLDTQQFSSGKVKVTIGELGEFAANLVGDGQSGRLMLDISEVEQAKLADDIVQKFAHLLPV